MALDLNLWDLQGGGGVGWGWPGGVGVPCILCSSMGRGGGVFESVIYQLRHHQNQAFCSLGLSHAKCYIGIKST